MTKEASATAEEPTGKATIGQSIVLLVGGSRGYLVVNLINFGDGVAYFGILTLLTLFLERYVGFTKAAAGMPVSVFTGAVTLCMLFGGFVSDSVGVRRGLILALVLLLVGRVLLVGPALTGAGTAGMALALGSLVVMAAGAGVLQPALYAGVKEYTDPRSASMGFAFLYSIMNLGIVGELLISPFLRELWARRVENADPQVASAGITGPFIFCAFITAVLLLLHLGLFTRRVEQRDRQVVAEAEPDGGSGNPLWRRLRQLPLMNARFLFFIFVLLPVRTLFAHQFLTIPSFIEGSFPVEVGKRLEWLAGINPLIIVIFVPLITALTQRVHVLTMMIVGSSITALSTFLLIGEPNLYLLIAYMVIFSFGEAAWSSRFLEYVADLAPAGRVGAYMGVAQLPWFMAKFTTGFYSGTMLATFVPDEGPKDPGTMWLIYGFIACVSPLCLLLARRWLLGGVPSGAKAEEAGS